LPINTSFVVIHDLLGISLHITFFLLLLFYFICWISPIKVVGTKMIRGYPFCDFLGITTAQMTMIPNPSITQLSFTPLTTIFFFLLSYFFITYFFFFFFFLLLLIFYFFYIIFFFFGEIY